MTQIKYHNWTLPHNFFQFLLGIQPRQYIISVASQLYLFQIFFLVFLITVVTKVYCAKVAIIIRFAWFINALTVIAVDCHIIIGSGLVFNEMIPHKLDHVMTVETFSSGLLQVGNWLFRCTFDDFSLSLKVGADVRALEILVLHHEFTCGAK